MNDHLFTVSNQEILEHVFTSLSDHISTLCTDAAVFHILFGKTVHLCGILKGCFNPCNSLYWIED